MDRLEQRFQETLDFGAFYDEVFTSDAAKRTRSARRHLQDYGSAEDLPVDEATSRRAHVACLNLRHLWATLWLSRWPLDSGGVEEGMFPSEIAAFLKEARYVQEWDMGDRGPKGLIESPEELEAFLQEAQALANLLRKSLPEAPFQTSIYRENMARLQKDLGWRYCKTINNGGEPGSQETVFAALHGIFIYTFVDEAGELKLKHVEPIEV